jgi:hypothetical protein
MSLVDQRALHAGLRRAGGSFTPNAEAPSGLSAPSVQPRGGPP